MKKKSVALLLAAVLALGTVLTGCSSNGGSSKDGKSLTVGVGAQFTTLDPGLNTEVINSYVMQHTCAGLFIKDDEGNVNEDLADSYEVSEDGLTYTVTLKDGLEWSDGEPLTAYDFEYGLKRNLVYGAENAWAINDPCKYLEGAEEVSGKGDLEVEDLEDFEGVKALDEKTIQYNLKKPCAFFTSVLLDQVFLPLREDFTDVHSSDWAMEGGYPSVGPYKLVECNDIEKCVIEKNDKYYKADEVTLDKITFMVMTDADAQEAAFKTGDLDVALGVKDTVVDSYENQNEVWMLPSVAVYFIALNSGESGPEALKDVNVRKALALGLDKEAMSEKMGPLYPAINGYVPSGMQGASDDFRAEGDAQGKMLEYDPEEAKALLAEAGYDESNPLKITYKYSDSSTHSDVAQLIEQEWKKIGVEVDLQVVESGVFYDQLDNGDFETARYGYVGATDPSAYLDLWTTSMQVVPAVSDPTFDKMVEDASYIVDRTEYMEALHEAEHYLVEENAYVIPLFDYSSAGLVKENVKNIHCAPGGHPYYGNVTLEDAE